MEQAKRDWEKAHEDELARYQKLLGNYNRLEQRYENVQEELFKSAGSTSTPSSKSEGGDVMAENQGQQSSESGEAEVKREGDTSAVNDGDVNMGLVMRLRNRLKVFVYLIRPLID